MSQPSARSRLSTSLTFMPQGYRSAALAVKERITSDDGMRGWPGRLQTSGTYSDKRQLRVPGRTLRPRSIDRLLRLRRRDKQVVRATPRSAGLLSGCHWLSQCRAEPEHWQSQCHPDHGPSPVPPRRLVIFSAYNVVRLRFTKGVETGQVSSRWKPDTTTRGPGLSPEASCSWTASASPARP